MPETTPTEHVPVMERRKRQLRQELSATATKLFLERGFDAVRVSEIARACGVTEKTVYNHFSCKEALLADRWDVQFEELSRLLQLGLSPLEAALRVLESERVFLVLDPIGLHKRPRRSQLRRFSELINSTPGLVAYHQAKLGDVVEILETAFGEGNETASDPRAHIAALAVGDLWKVFARSLRIHLADDDSDDLAESMRRDLEAAADVLRSGLDRISPLPRPRTPNVQPSPLSRVQSRGNTR